MSLSGLARSDGKLLGAGSIERRGALCGTSAGGCGGLQNIANQVALERKSAPGSWWSLMMTCRRVSRCRQSCQSCRNYHESPRYQEHQSQRHQGYHEYQSCDRHTDREGCLSLVTVSIMVGSRPWSHQLRWFRSGLSRGPGLLTCLQEPGGRTDPLRLLGHPPHGELRVRAWQSSLVPGLCHGLLGCKADLIQVEGLADEADTQLVCQPFVDGFVFPVEEAGNHDHGGLGVCLLDPTG